jgi:hypothetical protein
VKKNYDNPQEAMPSIRSFLTILIAVREEALKIESRFLKGVQKIRKQKL